MQELEGARSRLRPSPGPGPEAPRGARALRHVSWMGQGSPDACRRSSPAQARTWAVETEPGQGPAGGARSGVERAARGGAESREERALSAPSPPPPPLRV